MATEQGLWTMSEAADYLGMSPKSLLRLVQQSEFPAVQVGGEWRFVPERLSQWMDDRSAVPDSLRHLLRLDPVAVPIDRVLREQDIEIIADPLTKDLVLERLVRRLQQRYPSIDVERYMAGIEEREALAPTVVAPGIAFPHLRDISENPTGSVSLIFAVLRHPIQYGANRVYCTILICADDLVLHLRLLQKVSYLFSDSEVVAQLSQVKTPAAVLQRLMEVEHNRRR